MKKLLFILVAILGIAGFFYYYFSAPKVLERRLDSMLSTLSFGTISFGDIEKDADKFSSFFAAEVEFSGSGNSIIAGTVGPADMRELYLNQFRAAAKSSQAKRKGDFHVKLQAADRAEMDATIELDIVLRDNSSHLQTMPVRLTWRKSGGKWVITEAQLLDPINGAFDS